MHQMHIFTALKKKEPPDGGFEQTSSGGTVMTSSIITASKGKVYVGIDVHKRTYSVTGLKNGEERKSATMSANPKALISFLENNYSNLEINTVYEAGFSGFHLHRQLESAKIKNIIVNPASIETASNQRVKTDKKDSQKLAEHLCQKRLKGIRIPTLKEESSRLLSRTRSQLIAQRVRTGNQIKSKLFLFGLIDFNNETVMSKKYLENIKKLELSNELEELKITIDCLSDVWFYLSEKIRNIDLQLKKQAQINPNMDLIYQSVPGIGPLSSRILATELGDMSQFKNERALFSFVGLTPTEHSSGESIRQGHISRQGSARLRNILTECAWKNISKDPAMAEVFNRIALRRGKKRAIIAVARRLIGKIRACFKNNTHYKIGISKEEEGKKKED
jgi:transposase